MNDLNNMKLGSIIYYLVVKHMKMGTSSVPSPTWRRQGIVATSFETDLPDAACEKCIYYKAIF